MRHLDDPADTEAEQSPGDTADADAPLAAEDYQLAEALNVLKGLNLFRGAAAKSD
jgi:hypothetical protein